MWNSIRPMVIYERTCVKKHPNLGIIYFVDLGWLQQLGLVGFKQFLLIGKHSICNLQQMTSKPNEATRPPWRNRHPRRCRTRRNRRNRPRPRCPRRCDGWKWPCGAWNDRSGKRHWSSYPPRRVVSRETRPYGV